MTYDEAKQVVQEYFTNLQAKAGEMNAKAGKEYLANNAKEEGVKVTESGLQYLVVKEGNENTAKTKELKKALKSDEVRDYINKNYKGAVVPVF